MSLFLVRCILASLTPVNCCLFLLCPEFDVRTAIDPRELIEIPAFLFLTLCYAILLTFSRVGAVAPTTWPIGEFAEHQAVCHN